MWYSHFSHIKVFANTYMQYINAPLNKYPNPNVKNTNLDTAFRQMLNIKCYQRLLTFWCSYV